MTPSDPTCSPPSSSRARAIEANAQEYDRAFQSALDALVRCMPTGRRHGVKVMDARAFLDRMVALLAAVHESEGKTSGGAQTPAERAIAEAPAPVQGPNEAGLNQTSEAQQKRKATSEEGRADGTPSGASTAPQRDPICGTSFDRWGVFDTWNRRWCPRFGTEQEMGAHAVKLNANLREGGAGTCRYQPLPLPTPDSSTPASSSPERPELESEGGPDVWVILERDLPSKTGPLIVPGGHVSAYDDEHGARDAVSYFPAFRNYEVVRYVPASVADALARELDEAKANVEEHVSAWLDIQTVVTVNGESLKDAVMRTIRELQSRAEVAESIARDRERLSPAPKP